MTDSSGLTVIKTFFNGRSCLFPASDRGLQGCKVLLLLTAAADGEAWRAVQSEWAEKVSSRLGGQSLSGGSSLDNSGRRAEVSMSRRHHALRSALSILNDWADVVSSYSCAVLLNDYHQIRRVRNLMAPEALCVERLISAIGGNYAPPTTFEYFFFRDDLFMKQMRPYWSECYEKRSYYLRQVEVLSTVQASHVAHEWLDVFGWTVEQFCQRAWKLPSQQSVPKMLQGIMTRSPRIMLLDRDEFLYNAASVNRLLLSHDRSPLNLAQTT
jgi:hypothetical protein